jgi:hypothetical protein
MHGLHHTDSLLICFYFPDEKRIRVCSGCVIPSKGSTDTTKILTSATLVRVLNANNSVIPDVKVGATYNV